MIKVAIMGYGTIGSGVAEILEKNGGKIAGKAGGEISLKYILDLRDFPGSPVEHMIVHDIRTILDDPEIDAVVETMGGTKPAYDFVKACLEAGKHVATSNKALVAAHGTELLEIAARHQVNFFFDASVGGGIPIIRSFYECMSGENIGEITGILNGTTNYILTKMEREGETFAAALRQAQDLGYAEKDPTADVEGFDTCRKIAILTAVATGCEVDYQQIYTEGITKITDTDFKYAAMMGTTIKLFGSSVISEDGVHAYVVPKMINSDHPLYAVSDVYNAVLVKSDMLGTSMFYGSGAGKLPTASSVVADLIKIARHPDRNINFGWGSKKLIITSMDNAQFQYFVRLEGKKADRMKEAEKAFGQVKAIELSGLDEFAVVTENMTEKHFRNAMENLSGVRQIIRGEEIK